MATTSVHNGRRAVRLHERGPPAASTFFTSSLPLLQQDQALSLASGYLPARAPAGGSDAAEDAHLYFVLERARHMGNKRRLIIWFNGGPGCSSFDGLMMEIGAFRPDTRGGLEWTKAGGAWNEYADVMYLDQPVGTGFSYVSTNGYARSLEQAADEVVYFLKRLVEVYPEYAKGNGADVYLAGESYAGQYIPFTAAAILKQGRNSPVDLRGIAIGNGFIDPKAQGGTELEKMVQSKVWKEDSENYKAIKNEVDQCHKELDAEKSDSRKVNACNGILPSIIERTKATTGNRETCINIYDVRLSDTAPACGMNWPPTLKATYDYLARDDVRRALHVDSVHKPEAWVECSHRVGAGIESDVHGKASVVHLPYILEQQVPVLLFAGDKDLICNDIGVERVAERLQWGGEGWGGPAKKEWFVNQSKAGYWRTNRNLTFVSIADASHMVGVDKPIEGHDMMLRFMGVDLMAAAGPSARIPSRLEGETDRAVIVGGGGTGSTTGGTSAQDNRPMLPGMSGKTEEQVAEEAKWAAYYNAGSAALIVLLILVGAGTCVLLRLRRRARLLRRGGGGGGGSSSSSGSAPFLSADEEGREHEMDRFIPGAGRSTDNLSDDEDATYSDNTLDAMTVSNTLANGRRAENARKSADTQNTVAHRDAEQIFDVGDEDSDDDIGNAAAHRANDAVRFAA